MRDILQDFNEALRADARLGRYRIDAALERPGIIELRGTVDCWQDVVDIGFLAIKVPSVKNVVNRIDSPDRVKPPPPEERKRRVKEAESLGVLEEADVVIIGAGISGASIARALARYDLRIVVVEKEHDVSEGTSKANNGMIHSGHDPKHGSLKAELNVKGNAMFTQWAEELDFDMTRPGMVLNIFDESQDAALQDMYENALKNGVPGVKLVSNEEAHRIEPHLKVDVRRGLITPTAGYADPYEVVRVLLENAMDNGARLMLNTEVLDIRVEDGAVSAAVTTRGIIKTGIVINAGGLYADEIADMAGDLFYTIHPRKGTILIFDKVAGERSTDADLCLLPGAHTKGGGNMKTPTGNPLWGPSAKEVPDKENREADQDELDEVLGKVFTDGIEPGDIVTFFAGVRAPVYSEDFIIEASERVGGFIHVAGMQSPGFVSSPAVAERVVDIVYSIRCGLKERENYRPRRKGPPKFSKLTREEQDRLVASDPKYGRIVCRCEMVSEGELVDAIHGKIPARSLDGIKRRTRCGMGRCQGGFCTPRAMEILARETGIPYEKITKRGPGTEILVSDNRTEAEQSA